MVTLPPSSPVHRTVCNGRPGVDFIEEFREPRGWIRRRLSLFNRLFALAFPGFVAPVAASLDAVFADSGGVRARLAFRELLESFLYAAGRISRCGGRALL